MKMPNEIKKGLECCANAMMKQSCVGCPWFKTGDEFCNETVMLDALAYIQQLETELAAVKRERDAAIADLELCGICKVCKHMATKCDDCRRCKLRIAFCDKFEWRGVCPENTEARNGNQ